MSRQRVTAADVARSVGLSRTTVGFVLNNTPGQTIPERTRTRVLAEAQRLGYRPNPAAQALRRGSTRLVMLVVPDWPADPVWNEFVDDLSFELDQAGYSLVTYARRSEERARPLWETLRPDVIIGVGEFDADELNSALASGVRKVITQGVAASPIVSTGAGLQVRHLYVRGHRRLGYALPRDERMADMAAARLAVAQTVAAELGVEPLDVQVVDHRSETAAHAVQRWHEVGVTGVAAFNDFTAAALVGAAMRGGIGVPAPLAIIGHDDTDLARLFVPSLSSVRIDLAGLARYSASVALYAAGHPTPEPSGVTPSFEVIGRETT
ncbi:LacI family DNA-binding transcriptional regulator [Nocardia elegans]|uniref:LacI family DNA-binding transcriptional regulator n=1 Tax=Nocardia elegans TaxID=300029 RepID=UPI002B4B6A61|nr:LacI family DNA-binding transcriptional regulator [Nocardia elegans]